MSSVNSETNREVGLQGLWRERDVAARWGKSTRTLERWRAEGYGPAFIRIGVSIRYRAQDILDFEEGHRQGGGGSSVEAVKFEESSR